MLEELERRIAELEALHNMEVPEWAQEAVNAAVEAGIVDTPKNRSYDFYSILTILHRKDLI